MISVKYSKSGVYCNPSVIDRGKDVHIIYEGMLAKSGAEKVFAHVGYGPNDKWSSTDLYEMEKVGPNKFETEFTVAQKGNLNMAFKDSIENWDNNAGQNYTFENKEIKQ